MHILKPLENSNYLNKPFLSNKNTDVFNKHFKWSKLITICVSYVMQGSYDIFAAMTLLHIGWVAELTFWVSLFNEPSTAL